MPFKLYPHNQYAYDILKESLEVNQRACIVQPTGTGKSYITAEFLKENPTKKFLLLTSNSYIIDQFDQHFKNTYSNYKYVAYPSLLSRDFKKLLNESFDYIVLDEFHRVGAELWGLKVQELLNKNSNAKVIGLTATHIRYMEEERDMTEELFNGNLVHNLTLMECFDTGILPRPKYISTIYNIDDEYNSLIEKINKSQHQNKSQLRERIIEYRAKWEYSNGANIILKKHIKKERNFLIFCKDTTHLEEMMPVIKNWFKIFQLPINTFKVYALHSDSKDELKEFKAAATSNLNEFNLLFSVQQLNEGLHVPNVEGVLFLRPTESHIIYYQQLGRSLETKGNQPIVFDMVNNFNKSKVHTKFNETEYNPVFKNDFIKTDYDAYKFSFDIIDEVKEIKDILNNVGFNLTSSFSQIKNIEQKLLKNIELNDDDEIFISNSRRLYKRNKINKNKETHLNELIPLLGYDWKIHNNLTVKNRLKTIENIQNHFILNKAFNTNFRNFLFELRNKVSRRNEPIHYSEIELKKAEDLKNVGFNYKYTKFQQAIFYLNFSIKQEKHTDWNKLNINLRNKAHALISNYYREGKNNSEKKFYTTEEVLIIKKELDIFTKLTGKSWETRKVKKSFKERYESITNKLNSNILPDLSERKWISYKLLQEYKTSKSELEKIKLLDVKYRALKKN